MYLDTEKKERAWNHAVAGLCACVIFQVVVPLIPSASPNPADLPDCGQHVREGSKNRRSIYGYFPRIRCAFLAPWPQNGYHGTREVLEVVDKEQPRRLGFFSMERCS